MRMLGFSVSNGVIDGILASVRGLKISTDGRGAVCFYRLPKTFFSQQPQRKRDARRSESSTPNTDRYEQGGPTVAK